MYLINKPFGKTPLQAMEDFSNKEFGYVKKLTYAGRLDPFAEGLLPVVMGSETEEKKFLLSLPKTYEATFLFGVSTDSHDLLGVVEDVKAIHIEESVVVGIVRNLVGEITLPLPKFSSVPVSGESLFVHAKEGRVVNIPLRTTNIFSAEVFGFSSVSDSDILERIVLGTRELRGEFRQDEILNVWKEVLLKGNRFVTVQCRFVVSSGTYIRSIAVEVGKRLGVPVCVYKLVRTHVGEYTN